MKNFVCFYSVDAYDINDKVKTYYGILYADNFVDATQQLENDLFGTDLLKINEMELYDAIAHFSKETYTTMKKELEENQESFII